MNQLNNVICHQKYCKDVAYNIDIKDLICTKEEENCPNRKVIDFG